MSRETDNQAVAISKLGELTIGDCLVRLETRQTKTIGPSLSVASYVGMDPNQSHSSVKLRDKTLIRCCSTEDARKVMRLLQALEPFAKMYRRENLCVNPADLILSRGTGFDATHVFEGDLKDAFLAFVEATE